MREEKVLGVVQLFLLARNLFGIHMLRFSVPSYPQSSDGASLCHALKERSAKPQHFKACKCLNKNTIRMRKLYWINFSLICDVERCKEERETALSEALIWSPLPEHLNSLQSLMYLCWKHTCEGGKYYLLHFTDEEQGFRYLKSIYE